MEKRLVWDLPVRLFHWLLVISLVAQWITAELGDTYLNWHFYIGYFIIGLIIFRVIWGVLGTKHALFKNFFPTPNKLKQYLSQNKAAAGHNPMGALMVFFLLFVVLLQGVSGLFTTDDIFSSGPYREMLTKEWQDTADWLHGNVFEVIKIAAALHIVAVFYYLFKKKQNLIESMFTGKKTVEQAESINTSKIITAAIICIAVGIFVYWLVVIAPPVSEDDFYY